MIPKILCWLFGHIKLIKTTSFEKINDRYVWKNHWMDLDRCERCGVTLASEEMTTTDIIELGDKMYKDAMEEIMKTPILASEEKEKA